jgi:hypothetical protein
MTRRATGTGQIASAWRRGVVHQVGVTLGTKDLVTKHEHNDEADTLNMNGA